MEQIHLTVPHSSCLCTFYNNGKANIMVIDSVETDESHRQEGCATRLMEKALNLAMFHNSLFNYCGILSIKIIRLTVTPGLGYTTMNYWRTNNEKFGGYNERRS